MSTSPPSPNSNGVRTCTSAHWRDSSKPWAAGLRFAPFSPKAPCESVSLKSWLPSPEDPRGDTKVSARLAGPLFDRYQNGRAGGAPHLQDHRLVAGRHNLRNYNVDLIQADEAGRQTAEGHRA